MNKNFLIVLAMSFVLVGCGAPSSSDSDAVGTMPSQIPSQATPEAFQQQAMALLAQGQLPAAVETLQKAVELFPEDTTALFTLAQIYMKVGSFDNAIILAQKVLEKNPDDGQAFLLMAGCYDLKNEPQKAKDLVKMSLVAFQKQNDTKSFEAAASVLKKMEERPAGEKKSDKK